MSEQTTSSSLAIYKDMGDPLAYAERMGEAIAKSGIIECRQKETGTIIALHCISEGFDPIVFNRKYHIIQGRPSQRASSMLADFEAAGGKYEIIECSPNRAAMQMSYAGRTIDSEITWDEMKESRWPWKDAADHSKGLKDNWSTPEDRENQMWSRFISKWTKRIAPQLFYGTYSTEEMRDVAEIEADSVEATPPPTVDELVQEIDSAAATEGTVNDLQIARIMQLKEGLGMTPETLAGVVAKRNVSSLQAFSTEQGDELIEKMEAMTKAK